MRRDENDIISSTEIFSIHLLCSIVLTAVLVIFNRRISDGFIILQTMFFQFEF